MRRIAVAAVTAALLALGTAGGASASSPGCFGQTVVSQYAQNPPFGMSNLGAYVSSQATTADNFGQVNIPFYKSFFCGG